MKICTVIVARDEEYFIPITLPSVARMSDAVFVLDTGSADRTIDAIKAVPGNISWEQKHFGGRFPFDTGSAPNCRRGAPNVESGAYREMEARNYALKRAREIFDPDWILRMDADESFAPQLFDEMRTTKHLSLGFSCELPTGRNPFALNRTPSHLSDWGGIKMHDPHIFCWNDRALKVSWTHPEGQHVSISGLRDHGVITDPVQFHWHRCFGPKSIYTILYWERIARGEVLPYGDPTIFPFLTRETMYDVATWKQNMPERFDAADRFIVPKTVQDWFASKEYDIKIDQEITNAWEAFCVYEQ